ncbi:hypothetical protein NLJ89_g11058 [Agrocybe chaxingu]|uniref:DUF1524 domain-containing protein n=1 Tax=Agrocybe chaxingu TaxID=84603 RepID=A0A9W8JT37_9AGAR|nr:hypothetical protein NLJ89_g11058 [Agrocybe chaxingu]
MWPLRGLPRRATGGLGDWLLITFIVLEITLAALLSRRALPTPVSAATTRSYLTQLTVAVDSNSPANSHDLFKTWDIISGNCDTRETALKRDVATNSACSVTSEHRVSPYDGVATDLDHVVHLKEAWVSGAQREAFANDLMRPQLAAVTDNLNQSKAIPSVPGSSGDRDPANWLPPLSSCICTYVRAWVQVKYYYGLTIDSAEKTALTNRLAGC